MTPADVLAERRYQPFCGNGVLATINALADFSHSKAMADLVTAGKWKGELLVTLGKVAPPRYANFIGRYKDDRDLQVRWAVAAALGVIDNEAIAVPVLTQLLSRGDTKEEVESVRWEAASSLAKVAGRKGSQSARQRLLDLLQERDRMTVVLAARALAVVGDARGLAKLRELTGHAQPAVRYEAVLALGEIPDKGSREVLLRRLKDDSLAVRSLAIFALGELGDPSVVPALRKAVEDSAGLEEKYGLEAFDLRETLQAALTRTAEAARSTPLLSTAELLGEWANIDPSSRGIVKIIIEERMNILTVHTFGACVPTPCDWGAVKGVAYAPSISEHAARGFTAVWDHGFSEVSMLGIRKGDILEVTTYTKFKDNSARSNYFSLERFRH